MSIQSSATHYLTEFERKVAQRMSLDIRYYCEDSDYSSDMSAAKSQQGVTELPEALAELIKQSSLGGVVLFAENLQSTKQIVTLTHDLQQASMQSNMAKPLIISIDQEGGRVARFDKMTGFAGNMAIGASYPKHGSFFATQVNAIIGKELKALGINNNYAPVVDVNTNSKNPVINTRSFGESAMQVAELGLAAVNALQAQGVMATLKHFPGHGDTHVDSHLGLPRVDHDRATINAVDLAPFTWAIKNSKPAMIMTAHIQYPALDDSILISKKGDEIIRPATMSRKILTDLLRIEMAFDGIIATDALDMAGISQFFTENDAVVETLIAGADLALMPFKVRGEKDISAFYEFVRQVAKSLQARIELSEYSLAEFEQSIIRLNNYKQQYCQLPINDILKQITYAEATIATREHLKSEQALADAALTLLKNNRKAKANDAENINKHLENPVIPLSAKAITKIHLIVANQLEFSALKYALGNASDELSHLNISYFIADDAKFNCINEQLIVQADMVIATLDVKTASLVDLGGMDDMKAKIKPTYGSKDWQQQKQTYANLLTQQLILATKLNTASVLIAKGSPFLLQQYSELSDVVLLNFDDRVYQDEFGQMISPGFNASIHAVFGVINTSGQLPVSAL
ncbi:glycoside hydrolase family 3 N-terminal domain-containing protein [Colwellia sp. E2M01]|uniref:glycoside hydrolase family 3 N-terminal domain-containing protein n=1 Tax=Colwellia sp. E2M01 TaxID=2841561 RepID=UPI001C0995CC|nr:glycoside hydrolase family 3 N-terminal domain-containing protein [Colwellia sp. E2M01]MBU2870340.1 glycoside hydrolase family 3 protein [Colwellia sp. E2M01]